MAKSKMHYAWLILVGLCLMVGLGKGALNNTAGLFISPVSKDLGVGIGNLTLYLSISSIVTLFFLPIGGKLMAKYNIKGLLVVAILLQAGSFAAFGLMSSIWGWYILAIPLAIGGVFITVIAGPVLINSWFKKSNGLALGIMGAASGAIGAVTQPVVGNLIASKGWSQSYIFVGLAVLIIVIPVILLLIKKSPKEKGLLPYGASAAVENGEAAENESEKGISIAVARKSGAFYSLALFFFLITAIGSFSIHIPTFLANKGYSVEFSGTVMGVYMIGVLLGSLILGILSDKIGSKNTSLLAMILGGAAVLMLLFFANVSGFIMVAAVLLGFMIASIGTLAPALTATLFGSKDYSQIYSLASLGLAVASIIALPAYGYIYDFTGTYTIVLWIIVGMFIVNILAVLFAFTSKKKLVDQGHWN
ncbi:MFS transporter [Sporosarcina sp. NCCP-2716]|uniref:MFS transporter n=1 Tax=Sporosarcina sp. NCCP-2716 TaxID=2943679 RepID=UPI00203D95B7|nr:MFS transporter [Sporosarcina sp. NCCP-2716]GKV70307.1 MFS transporter [Sporosarcina sp. NCCP-2716]